MYLGTYNSSPKKKTETRATNMNEQNAKKKSATPVPARLDRQGEDDNKLGLVFATGSREDNHDFDHYQRAVRGEDLNYSAKTSGGNSMGYGDY
jgi:hypothetical protein